MKPVEEKQMKTCVCGLPHFQMPNISVNKRYVDGYIIHLTSEMHRKFASKVIDALDAM